MANQTLINLKKIYNIENDGTILELLRNARNSKANLDNFGRVVAKRKKDLAQKLLDEQKSTETKPEPAKEVVEVSVAPKTQETRNSNPVSRTENAQNTRREQFARPQGDRQFSSQRPNNGQRTFNQNGERPFTPRNQNGMQGQRPQRDGYNRNGQSGKPPFANKPRPQGTTGAKGTNFVSTKQNLKTKFFL